MDEYLDCLYQYVSDRLEADAQLDLIEYSRRSDEQNTAWAALKTALTPEQLHLVEDYRAAWCGLRFLEDRLLFQKAVSLGKWMAR
ncbi:hypothetical protein [uncultured Oscillibacter sp.]|uniref:hypothetical protein n=1 Tax=uncultured Oscillibacter sp. TaxID=876091 RepID=UPI002617E1D7|nr:hypothetical protein [uncultured Oscillibacter sp.]